MEVSGVTFTFSNASRNRTCKAGQFPEFLFSA